MNKKNKLTFIIISSLSLFACKDKEPDNTKAPAAPTVQYEEGFSLPGNMVPNVIKRGSSSTPEPNGPTPLSKEQLANLNKVEFDKFTSKNPDYDPKFSLYAMHENGNNPVASLIFKNEGKNYISAKFAPFDIDYASFKEGTVHVQIDNKITQTLIMKDAYIKIQKKTIENIINNKETANIIFYIGNGKSLRAKLTDAEGNNSQFLNTISSILL